MAERGVVMDKDIILQRIEGEFDSFELFLLTEKTKKFESRDKDLYGVEMNEEEGVALRGIKDKKMIFSYTFEKGQKAADALLDNAKMLVSFIEVDQDATIPKSHADYPSPDLFDQTGLMMSDTEKTSRLIEMEAMILDYDKRIVTTRNCELQEAEVEIEIINSKGLRAYGRKTLYSLFALCVAREEDEVSWYDWAWAHSLADIDMKSLGVDVAKKTVSFLGGEQIATGIYDGILTPQASCEILSVLSGSFLAESLHKNKTRLKDRLGEQCFSEMINIVDSGLAGMDAFPFDGEGVPSQDNILIEKGVFKTFLYDTYYGKKFNSPSTGNVGRSGLKEPPVCGRRGFFIKSGGDDVSSYMSNGLIIEELMGTHTANPITGDFSLGAVGHLVRDGVKKPFKGVIFSGNIFDLLNSVKGVGNDLRFYGTCGSPSLVIEGMKISGK
jgi:PmbA protein